MGKFSLYNVELKNLTPGVHEYSYFLENQFFIDIDGDLVQKGKVDVYLKVKRSSMMFEMDFQIQGVVMVPCDRCLDDVEIPIDTQNRLVVKFGKEYTEESEEVVAFDKDEKDNHEEVVLDFDDDAAEEKNDAGGIFDDDMDDFGSDDSFEFNAKDMFDDFESLDDFDGLDDEN